MEIVQSDISVDRSPADNLILPFQAELAGVSGRLVRLGSAVDDIVLGHTYPEPVCKLLGEAVALTALLGASLKFDGKFIFQTKTDGPVSMLVIDYLSTGQLRGYARYDIDKVAQLEAAGEVEPEVLLGKGHLAMTIDRGPSMDSYQGVVALEGANLSEAADAYFRQSEQLPTFIRVAVARHYTLGSSPRAADDTNWHWRAGGLMVQHLTREGGHGAADRTSDEDDWNRARILASTVQPEELVDPMLSPEQLLYRLFHEERVRAFKRKSLSFKCGCSEERVKAMLSRFRARELEDMAEDGQIRVTCEFCNARYDFSPEEVA
jgi:molecular chaperone Hsp33